MAKVKKIVDKGPVCVKCGAHEGWSGPTFQKGERVTIKRPTHPTQFRAEIFETTESLVYMCHGCGYRRHESTKDRL